jgi:hypothetical protein
MPHPGDGNVVKLTMESFNQRGLFTRGEEQRSRPHAECALGNDGNALVQDSHFNEAAAGYGGGFLEAHGGFPADERAQLTA